MAAAPGDGDSIGATKMRSARKTGMSSLILNSNRAQAMPAELPVCI
jgi:hypothetical protein